MLSRINTGVICVYSVSVNPRAIICHYNSLCMYVSMYVCMCYSLFSCVCTADWSYQWQTAASTASSVLSLAVDLFVLTLWRTHTHTHTHTHTCYSNGWWWWLNWRQPGENSSTLSHTCWSWVCCCWDRLCQSVVLPGDYLSPVDISTQYIYYIIYIFEIWSFCCICF